MSVALCKVATDSTTRSGSPLSSQPKRTANAPSATAIQIDQASFSGSRRRRRRSFGLQSAQHRCGHIEFRLGKQYRIAHHQVVTLGLWRKFGSPAAAVFATGLNLVAPHVDVLLHFGLPAVEVMGALAQVLLRPCCARIPTHDQFTVFALFLNMCFSVVAKPMITTVCAQ